MGIFFWNISRDDERKWEKKRNIEFIIWNLNKIYKNIRIKYATK